MPVTVNIPSLGDKFQDYRDPIPGDSYNWGPAVKATDINYFTFHHSVTKQTAKDDGDWKKECNYIANLHITPEPNGRGWGGVGYRFIICSDGTVAYVGDLSHGGSAVADKNHIMFSACFVGDFTKENPTDAQITSAHKLAKHFLEAMPSYPNLNDWGDVKGHQEWNPTACPGTNWKKGGDSIYERIKNNIPYTPVPTPPPAPTPPPPIPAPTPPPPIPVPPPVSTPPVSNAQLKLNLIRDIVYGKGWPWTKINKIKTLLP